MHVKSALSLVLFATLSGSLLAAQQSDGPGPRGPMDHGRGGWGERMHSGLRIGPPGIWWKNPDLIQKLNLSPDQQKRMDDIFQQSRIQLVHMKATLEEEQILLEPMLNANPPDSTKTLAQIDHIADARADLEKANAKMLLGIRTVLTPDQWTKLQEEGRNRRMRMHRGEMQGGPGGHDGPDSPRGGAPNSPNGDAL
jgi:Spy/CpxP family protein refolding chaperone